MKNLTEKLKSDTSIIRDIASIEFKDFAAEVKSVLITQNGNERHNKCVLEVIAANNEQQILFHQILNPNTIQPF